ncbi:MAG: N-acetylneuraminate synthase family protein [Candidatus Aenigmarchaeota archaeon]|nr:N-acetylneuraminate synthase family protein [Candidatus Aenigmarchaeota archaeon]
MFIGDKELGKGRTFIIAEVAHAHEGDVSKMKLLIKAAGESGADAIKFQKVVADELVVENDPRHANFKKMEFSETQWKEFFDYARSLGLIVLGEPFDESSADFFEALGVAGYKIHSTDLSNPSMLEKIAKKGTPILLATGGTTLDEIGNAIKIIKKHHGKIANSDELNKISIAKSSNEDLDIILVHGYQNFPTRVDDSHLAMIRFYKEEFGLIVGYHDHVDADSAIALILPVMAIGAGAVLIDKHITYDRSKKGIDHESSLNPDEFKQMVLLIRECEKSIGNIRKEMSDDEIGYRRKFKKNIVVRTSIRKGQIIKTNNIAFKRSEPGLSPMDAIKIVGNRAKRDMEKDHVIRLEDCE